MSKWWDIVKKSDNPSVLLMLSGGKDSIAALLFMVEKQIPVTAIHFVHRWGKDIPTFEAERICNQYHVELIKIDFSSQFFQAINGSTDGRPCLLCKKQMYSCLQEFLRNNKYGWLAIGDNGNDTTTIARMKKFGNSFGDDMVCSDYFGTEMGSVLPEGMHVLRPLINLSAKEVEKTLCDAGITVKRINSTGDKYFEYHREGCPVQFIDNGYPIDRGVLQSLKEYNIKITEFARARGIRASIHMPSTFIVTIPEGYEREAAQYLKDNGLKVNEAVNFRVMTQVESITAFVELSGTDIVKYQTYRKLFARLIERMQMVDSNIQQFTTGDKVLCIGYNQDCRITMTIDDKTKFSLDFVFMKCNRHISASNIRDLLIEIFRTRKIGMNFVSMG